MELTRIAKKADIINMTLENLVRQKEIEKIFNLSGKVSWSGDLDKMRADRRLRNIPA